MEHWQGVQLGSHRFARSTGVTIAFGGLQQKLFILTRPRGAANMATHAFYGLVALLKGVRPGTWQSFSETLGPLGTGCPPTPDRVR